MPPTLAPVLTDADAVAAHRVAVVQTRALLHDVEDWVTAVRRARLAVDSDGRDPRFEPLRQREGAIAATVTALQDRVAYLLAALADAEGDVRRLASDAAA